MHDAIQKLSLIESLRLIDLKALDITPETLAEFRAVRAMLGERPVRSNRLSYFIDLIRNGDFNYPEWVVLRDAKTGELFRANGQHTSGALASFPEEEFPVGLQARYCVFESEDIKKDKNRIFKIFDNKKSARGNGDCMANYAAEYPEFAGLSPSFLINVANGINLKVKLALEKNPLELLAQYPSQDHGLYYTEKHNREFALWVHQWVGVRLLGRKKVRIAHNEWLIGNCGIMAEMLIDWSALPEIATEFWEFVLKENHPEEDHATHALADTLMDWRRALRQREPIEYMKKAAKEWKAYSRERVAETEKQSRPNGGSGISSGPPENTLPFEPPAMPPILPPEPPNEPLHP